MLQTQMPNMRLCLWSNTEGLKTMPISVGEKIGDADVRLREIPALFTHMREQLKKPDSNQTIYLLRDLHAMMNDPRTRRAIRDIAEYFQDVYMPIMILSPEILIHDDVARLFRTVTYELPDKTLLTDLVDAANTKVQTAIKKGKTQYIPISKDQYPVYVEVLRGLTKLEVTNILLESLIRFKTLNLEFLTDYKIQKIRKSGALGYKKPTATLKDLGGHGALKSWVSEINCLYSKEARTLGLPQPKGVILLGAPGNGKTKFAEALAGELRLPLLTLEMSRILSSMVGSSEANMRRAISMIKASAPCCVILDEVEKAIGGVNSSNNSDSGIVARVFQQLLIFFQENEDGVFMVCTSNDISQLPPELTRSGRFDGIWYFAMPDEAARAEIFSIHFAKYNIKVAKGIPALAASLTKNYTGAEIEEAVKVAVRKAFIAGTSVTEKIITEAVQEVIPIWKSSQEQITKLQDYCRGRYRFTDGSESQGKRRNHDVLLDFES